MIEWLGLIVLAGLVIWAATIRDIPIPRRRRQNGDFWLWEREIRQRQDDTPGGT